MSQSLLVVVERKPADTWGNGVDEGWSPVHQIEDDYSINDPLNDNNFLPYILNSTIVCGWYDYGVLDDKVIHTSFVGEPYDISPDSAVYDEEFEDYITQEELQQVDWDNLMVPYDCSVPAVTYYEYKEYGILPSEWAAAYGDNSVHFPLQWSVPFKKAYPSAYKCINNIVTSKDEYRLLIRYI